MSDLTLINKNVSEALKKDSNEVTYKAWLFFTENAQLIENNIVVLVPNQYTKNIIEERYFIDMESLYRLELDFNDLILKLDLQEEEKMQKNSFGAQLSNKLDDLTELINTHINNIYDFIDSAIKSGISFVSYALIDDSLWAEEIYWKIKEYMMNKGFKVELCRLDNSCILNLTW